MATNYALPADAPVVGDDKRLTLPWLHLMTRWHKDIQAAGTGGGGGGTGTVTSVSVASANGFAGTVATATTTPAITLRTTLTGLLKGNGTALSVATAGIDYETAGAGAGAVATHVGLADPHTQYALDTDLAGYVPTTCTVNAKPLSANVTLTAADVGAPSGSGTSSGTNTGDQTITLTGDVTGSGTGSFAATIGAGKVTYAQIQNVSATSRILSRRTAGAGSAEESTLSQVLDFVGSAANGDILSRQAGTWNRLAIGTTGQVLTVVGGVPAWGSNELQLANVTLGTAGTSLASGTITACKFLRIEIYIAGYGGSDTASLQFNGAAGTAYRYRWLTSAAGGSAWAPGLVAASTDRIKIGAADTTNSRVVVANIRNFATVTEKLVKFESQFGTGSAGTQDTMDLGQGAWVSGASTQITSVSLVSSSNMNVGTQMTIYGWN